MITTEQAIAVKTHADRLYSVAQIEAAIQAMAEAVTHDLEGHDPVVMCIMNGGLVLTGILLPQLDFALRTDYLHATRYRGRTFGTDLEWRKHHELDLSGEHVLVVDDILDEGRTLHAICDHCRKQGASEVRSAVLVRKDRPRELDVCADYVGLEVPDRYVFGFGMDYKGYWRNAPGIFAVAAQ